MGFRDALRPLEEFRYGFFEGCVLLYLSLGDLGRGGFSSLFRGS